ncbi:peroxisome assembly protein [Thraustotheca clavata]|uniref:RING-type E3 ubiquitin transferase (cysteine targeting) n=1 Tax=Thraustotheca clavata TaxID=74557 RepID=A0A1W0A7A5_9STRA|nr:peroxisome assembly protein [Thraustotheca clavata]
MTSWADGVEADLDRLRRVAVNNEALAHASTNYRVNKWDALVLDSEIVALMKHPIKSMFALFQPGLMEKYQPEIDGVTYALLFALSVGMHQPTPGMKLQNLQFAKSSLVWKKIVPLFFLSVGIPYAWQRIHRALLSYRWREDRSTQAEAKYQHFLTMIHRVSTVAALVKLVNHLAFWKQGQYRSLPERLVGMKLTPLKHTVIPRTITFEYMNRQLVWDGFVEFCYFVLPLINWQRFGRLLKQTTKQLVATDTNEGNNDSQLTACALCSVTPAKTPYITSCGHQYCYFCLQTAVAMDPNYTCAMCGEVFESSERLTAGHFVV